MSEEKKKRREYGTGSCWKTGRFYWIQFSNGNGSNIRMSTKSTDEKAARKMLREKIGLVSAGITPDPRGLRYEHARTSFLKDRLAKSKSLPRKPDGSLLLGDDGLPSINAVTRLDGFFKNMRAKNISTDVLNEFIAEQQKLGFAPGSINRSLAALRRMLKIAARDGKLNRVPHFPMLREAEPRAGFLEATDYHKLLAALPSHLRVVLGIGFWCGLRIGEIRSLRWSQIDFFERTLSLRALETKNNTARVVPLSAELLALLEAHRKACPPGFEFVAFQPGEKGTVERLRTFTRAWGRCCKQVGLEGRLFHDLRRSAVRNLTRAGVSQAVAMTISGHKTASVFRRYNIVDVKDLADAGKKLEVYLTAEAAKEISAKLVQNEVPAEEKKLLTN